MASYGFLHFTYSTSQVNDLRFNRWGNGYNFVSKLTIKIIIMKTKIYLFAAIVSAIISMKAQIHPGNSLVVPEFGTGLSKTYVSNGAFQVIAKPYFTINLKTVPNSLATNAGPNTVAMYNNDLFVSLSQANQRIYKFPNYGPDPVQSIANVSPGY